MRKAFIIMMSLAAMLVASTGLKAQEIVITLEPGWNWISYPNAEAMDIASALGDFEPMEGDVIKSHFSNSTYSRGRWSGGVTHFIPGKGYKYYSTRTDDVEFVFAQPSSTSVATATPTGITATSAVVSGMVILPEGTHVFLRGVCWGTEPSPDIDGSHTSDGMGIGSFSDTLEGLNMNTTYYVRAYAVSEYGLAYGNVMTFTTMSGIPQVSTIGVTDITINSAVCGGIVTDDGGLDITTCGVCWSEEPNPTIEDSHTIEETGMGSFSSSLTNLDPGTIYYVRAYVTNAQATYYGGEMSFTTLDYGYIDLGLPSGLLWATCNVGAETPEDYGNYFAWGETQPKSVYNWSTYQYCNGSSSTLTKYCTNSTYGYNGFTDNLTILLPEDDAAAANWGGNWRTPTKEEWQELLNNTTSTWTTQNGVNGRLFTAANGNSLFLPAAGCRDENILDHASIRGFYWSNSLDLDNSRNAWRVEIYSDDINTRNYYRYYGRSIRAVRYASQSISFVINATANPSGGGVVSGGGNYQEGFECTLTATANTDYIFINWTENDSVVSTDATYTFIVNADRNLVANFIRNCPTGAINGLFSVSASLQVYFSQGNLQYIGSASTPYWKFAENQWDFLGTTTGQNSSGQNVDRDLFGWGTSGFNHGANCYQPWSTSQTNSDYYAYGSYTYNLYDQTGQADWGYNPIRNGGNQANQWRTLTKNEWAYVFNTRTTNSGIRYAKAKVNDVNGVILLPDDWSSDTYSLSNTNSSGASYSSNTITALQWSALEQAGAVFLPAAGGRRGASVSDAGSNGFYWSASNHGSYDAWYVRFFDSSLYTDRSNYRDDGFSVRLTRVAGN